MEGRYLKLVQFLDECALDPLASESHGLIKTHCCIVSYCPSTFKLTACLWQVGIKVLQKSKDRLFFLNEGIQAPHFFLSVPNCLK